MKSAAANLDFERAAALRDTLKTLRSRELGLTSLRRAGSWVLDRGRELAQGRRSSRCRSTSACRARRFARIFTRPFYFRDVVEQFEQIGIGSLTVVC